MHELIEGLEGMEVIADDFIVCYGESKEAAVRSHNNHNLDTSYSGVKTEACT